MNWQLVFAAFVITNTWALCALHWLLVDYPDLVEELPDWYRRHICDEEEDFTSH